MSSTENAIVRAIAAAANEARKGNTGPLSGDCARYLPVSDGFHRVMSAIRNKWTEEDVRSAAAAEAGRIFTEARALRA